LPKAAAEFSCPRPEQKRYNEIGFDTLFVKELMFMKNIIVTGCHGQLGIAVNKLLGSREDYHLINTDVAELDITKVDKVLELAREVKPYAIINCAAYTAVDAAEEHLDLNYKINALGPRNLAIAAAETGAKLVHISTDYVFPGDNPKPLTEFDPVGPKSVYGITKLAGENFVKDFARNYFIIRTAWLYGEGKNFVRTMLRLSETHEEVSVVNDQFGSPTSTAELAKAIECLLPTDNYGLFHGTCEGSTSWDEFTREIFRLAGRTTKVNSVSTAQYQEKNPQAAPRPHYSILDNYMFRLTTDFMYKDWQSALDDYMTEQGYKA
jgi:dTDP-4-dehydrorhamnose reductase